jgi:predicted transcriptional regulator
LTGGSIVFQYRALKILVITPTLVVAVADVSAFHLQTTVHAKAPEKQDVAEDNTWPQRSPG